MALFSVIAVVAGVPAGPTMKKLFLWTLRAVLRFILLLVGSAKVSGGDNVPLNGPYIAVVNHMSKADVALVFLALPIPPLEMRFFAGEKWGRHFFWGPLLKAAGAVFINRGEVDRRALREAIGELRQGSVFGLAPEGTRSRVGSLIRAKDGAAYLATRTGVPVLPIGIVNSDVLGANLYRLQRTRMECRIGRPFTLPEPDGRVRSSDLAAYTHYIMVHIAAQLPERYHGYYLDSPALAALMRGDDPWPYCLQAESSAG
jgi:1-acyl-sn-glycerol-3-phosphate acyltransferase